jgi:hypothetical protein
MLVGFGLGWSGEQVALMVAFVEAVTAWLARRQVRRWRARPYRRARPSACRAARPRRSSRRDVDRLAVVDALDAMPARDVERLIAHAQRRLARCFACGTDGAFPTTITSKKGGRNSSRASIRICAACWERSTLPEARATDG